MNYTFEPIRQFKFKSNFVKILLAMISLCIVLSILFVSYISKLISSKTLEYSAQSAQSYADIILDNTDNYIISLHQSLTQLSYSKNVFSTALAKEVKSGNNNLVTSELALTANNNLLIDQAVMYIPKQNLVLTSSYKTFPFETSPYSALIMDYENHSVLSKSVEDSSKVSSIFLYGSQLVLARDFPLNGPKKLATLFYIVDMDELFRRTTQELSGNGSILVFDSFDHPVFSSKTNYPQDIAPELLSAEHLTDNRYYKIGNTACFLSTSGITDWKILYKLDETGLRPTHRDILLSLSPIILIVTATAFLFSIVLAAVIYAPIQRLFSSVQTQQDLPAPQDAVYKNEFDLISRSFHQMSDRQTELNTIINNVSDSIITKLFADLLRGTQFESAEAERILKDSKSPFRLNAFYVASVLSLNSPQSVDELPPALLEELCSLISDYCNKHGAIYQMTAVGHNHLAIVFSFPTEESVIKLIKGLADLEPVIRGFSRAHQLPVQFNVGHMYHSLLDIGLSYQEALNAIESEQPSKASSEETASPDGPELRKELMLPARARQVLDLVQKDDIGSAVKLSNRIIDEIWEKGHDFNDCYRMYLNSIRDGISKIDYINFNALPNELIQPKTGFLEDINPEEGKAAMKDSCEAVIQQLGKILKRKNNPYIVSSQKYIHEHYKDYELSQNAVAEALGIKSSYLSKLFKESLGVSFTDYLNGYRIRQSLPLLRESSEMLSDIAAKSGFNSVQNYIRVFKKHMNMTPGQYRKGDEVQ